MVVGALFVIGVLFIFARYYLPYRERIRTRELDIRDREQQTDAERVKANVALAENMRGLRESNDQIARQFAAQTAGLEESKARSRGMDGKVDRIDHATAHAVDVVEDTNGKVTEMRTQLHDLYGMLNKRKENPWQTDGTGNES
ncbi:MAG: hypothetical protein U0M51_04100 [Eggerthellaceae bacterium]